MWQNEYGGAKHVTGHFYLYAKNKGTSFNKIMIFIIPLEKNNDPVIIGS